MAQEQNDSLMAEVSEFIMAYYSNLVYTPQDIPKFYDPENATIWRPSLNSKIGVKFAEAQEILVPVIEKGSQVSVIDYAIVPLENGYSLIVTGRIEGSKPTGFVQSFTIAHKHERVFIVCDAFRNGLAVTSEGEEVVYVPPRKKPAKREKKPARQAGSAEAPAQVAVPVPTETKDAEPKKDRQTQKRNSQKPRDKYTWTPGSK